MHAEQETHASSSFDPALLLATQVKVPRQNRSEDCPDSSESRLTAVKLSIQLSCDRKADLSAPRLYQYRTSSTQVTAMPISSSSI